jgi:regulator of protease activity HflC (stomatin/prohibitin superfamily)
MSRVKTQIGLGLGTVVVVMLIVLAGMSITIVGPTERGVMKTFGKVDETKTLEPGLIMKIPFVQSVSKYDLSPVTVAISISIEDDAALSADKQSLGVEGTVNWRYDENEIVGIATSFSSRRLLSNQIGDIIVASIKNVIGQYAIDNIVVDQDAIAVKARNILSSRLSNANIPVIVTALNLSNWDWNAEYEQMIRRTVEMQQATQRATAELAMIEVSTQKQVREATAKANAEIAQAEGRLKAAQLDAEAEVTRAKGRNDANRLLNQNLNVEIKIRELEIARIEAERFDGRRVPSYLPLNPAGGIVTLPAVR